MGGAGDFKAETKNLKARLKAEHAAREAAAKERENRETLGDYDLDDWGRTASQSAADGESDLKLISELESASGDSRREPPARLDDARRVCVV